MSLVLCGVSAAPGSAWSEPVDCPPACDRIPASAWPDPAELPLARTYRWPALADRAAAVTAPRFRFEPECALPPVPADPRGYAVAARAAVERPEGHWQMQVTVIHWRGETWLGGQTALAVVQASANALRGCPVPEVTITTDEPGRLAAVLDLPSDRVLHQYLLADAGNSTVVELALWSPTPAQVAWSAPPDDQLLDALAGPLCTAYIGSCR